MMPMPLLSVKSFFNCIPSVFYLILQSALKYNKRNITAASLGTEELAHMEMISAIVYQLTKNLSMEEIEKSGFDKYYVDHTLALWPQAAGGIPFNACVFQSKGDAITDLTEDLAADGATIQEQHGWKPLKTLDC